jgi:hypothetical protein
MSAEEDDATLLMGDAINNFRTIQSFGFEDKIVSKYQELVEKANGDVRCDVIKKSMTMFLS